MARIRGLSSSSFSSRLVETIESHPLANQGSEKIHAKVVVLCNYQREIFCIFRSDSALTRALTHGTCTLHSSPGIHELTLCPED